MTPSEEFKKEINVLSMAEMIQMISSIVVVVCTIASIVITYW